MGKRSLAIVGLVAVSALLEWAPAQEKAKPTQEELVATIEKLGGVFSGEKKSEGFIGIRMMDAPMRILDRGKIVAKRAVQILDIIPDAAAEKAGLRPGDRIVKLDGKPFGEELPAYVELSEHVRSKAPGEKITLSIKRAMKAFDIEVELGARPIEEPKPNLNLNGKQITNTELVHLKEMTWLETLDLGGTKITDDGLVHLEGLTGLKELNLKGTGVTDAGVAKIKAVLPECKIQR